MLSPTVSSFRKFVSEEEGEKLGEVCILDDVNMIPKVIVGVDEFWWIFQTWQMDA